jgi:hypothetical protein
MTHARGTYGTGQARFARTTVTFAWWEATQPSARPVAPATQLDNGRSATVDADNRSPCRDRKRAPVWSKTNRALTAGLTPAPMHARLTNGEGSPMNASTSSTTGRRCSTNGSVCWTHMRYERTLETPTEPTVKTGTKASWPTRDNATIKPKNATRQPTSATDQRAGTPFSTTRSTTQPSRHAGRPPYPGRCTGNRIATHSARGATITVRPLRLRPRCLQYGYMVDDTVRAASGTTFRGPSHRPMTTLPRRVMLETGPPSTETGLRTNAIRPPGFVTSPRMPATCTRPVTCSTPD